MPGTVVQAGQTVDSLLQRASVSCLTPVARIGSVCPLLRQISTLARAVAVPTLNLFTTGGFRRPAAAGADAALTVCWTSGPITGFALKGTWQRQTVVSALSSLAHPSAPHQLPQSSAFPSYDANFEGLRRIHADPDVFIISNMLNSAECQALIRNAMEGRLTAIRYENAVLLNYEKLKPLTLVVLGGGLTHMLHVHARNGDWHQAMQAGLQAAGLWATAVTLLSAAAQSVMAVALRGRIFTGQKWRLGTLAESDARAAAHKFLKRTAELLYTTPGHLEPATVTRYCPGEYQRKHIDARSHADSGGSAAFLQAGGQRLVQCLVYLNTMRPDQGGGTRFHNPLFKGLTVTPRQGDAVVFFPATQDGTEDPRMVHSGEAVVDGTKWCINTWACQYVRGDALVEGDGTRCV